MIVERSLKVMSRKFIPVLFALAAVMPVAGQEAAQEKALLDYPLDTINGEEVYRYEVERSVGLYRVGVNFNVSQNEIVRLNPQLKERGLHFGEIIYLPTGRTVKEPKKPKGPITIMSVALPEQEEKPETSGQESLVHESPAVVIAADTTITTVPDTAAAVVTAKADTVADTVPDTRPVVELALMLPFESHQTKRSGNAERMSEFYQGALLALKEMQHDSVRYRLRVYDTERSERRINALCDSTELDSVRGILGLVYPIQIEQMASWCFINQVPLLLPFSDDVEMQENPQLLQFNSTDQQEADSLCTWIAAHNVHCIHVDVRESDVASSIRVLRNEMKKRGIVSTGLPLHDLMNDSATYALDPTRENLIILHSDRYQHVRILMPHLSKMEEAGYRIRLLSQYSWQKENIGMPQLYTSVFTSEASHESYDATWTRFFGSSHVSESPRYDLLGYDLMHALVAWINGSKESKGLQTDIRWTQTGKGGWQNASVKVVEN